MAHGDYMFWQSHYQRKNADVDYTGAPMPAVISPKSPNHQLWVQKLSFYGVTGTLIASYTFDPGGGPETFTLGTIDRTLTSDQGLLDFGPQGTPLEPGVALDLSGTATGGRVHIEAYEKLAVPMAMGPNN